MDSSLLRSMSTMPPLRLTSIAALLCFARELGTVIAFNLLIAVCLNLTSAGLGGFGSIVTYSQCIGLCVYAVHLLSREFRLPGPASVQTVVRFGVCTVVGFSIGARLGAWLVGDPTPVFMILTMPPVAVVTTVISSLGIIYFFWSRARIREEAEAHALATRLALETQLKLLRAQLEPHMLFNTLANLRTLVEVDPPAAVHMLDQLIVFLRATLAASRTEVGLLSREFELLGAYLQLMQIRIGTRLTYALDLNDALEGALVPPMLLQPLVENAIKHGVEPAVAGGHIGVSARSDGRILHLRVEDTGLGPAPGASDTGYGLNHVRERLDALYPGAARLEIQPLAPHGMRVEIDLPLSFVR